MGEFRSNPWVQFLRQYSPVPRNDNMYDESIQRMLRRTRMQPIEFDAPYLPQLLENFQRPSPLSVILTGTAGDGKTYLCRRVWEHFGGDPDRWDGDDKVRHLPLPNGKTLITIKDLSELRDNDCVVLEKMAAAIAGGSTTEVFLLAANDGQLIEAWARLAETPPVLTTRSLIEELLVTQRSSDDKYPLLLYNLSRASAADLFERVLKAVLGHHGWQGCKACQGHEGQPAQRCPIYENFVRLGESLFQERLRHLLELCDHSDYHLTVRQLFLLISNILLGHPDGKDAILRCIDIHRMVSSGVAFGASPYSNVFGRNLPTSRRESLSVFDVLNRFGIGDETSNQIDRLLIFGNDDSDMVASFSSLIASDPAYGASSEYLKLQRLYLEGGDEDACLLFVELLAAQRQRLFFVIPDGGDAPVALWDLTVFHFAGEYLDLIHKRLRSVPRHILGRLVRGLNRIFTGMLVANERQLVLATSGSYSQSKVSRIEETAISVDPDRGQKVVLDLVNGRMRLAVYLDRDTLVPLSLDLVRYEFLCRVAEGALPSSFSRECYESLLAFKSRLLREHQKIVDKYGEQPPEDHINLNVLRLDKRGQVTSRPLEIQLPQ